MLRRFTFVVALLVAVTACTSAVTLRNPQTGATVKCGPYCCVYGARHDTAVAREDRCISDYQRQGYERVPE